MTPIGLISTDLKDREIINKKTLILSIRLLEECLEEECTPEELRSKIRDILKLLGGRKL